MEEENDAVFRKGFCLPYCEQRPDTDLIGIQKTSSMSRKTKRVSSCLPGWLNKTMQIPLISLHVMYALSDGGVVEVLPVS